MSWVYLNNPSEEAIFESSRIKEEHETIKHSLGILYSVLALI